MVQDLILLLMMVVMQHFLFMKDLKLKLLMKKMELYLIQILLIMLNLKLYFVLFVMDLVKIVSVFIKWLINLLVYQKKQQLVYIV